jgi:uncharacterized protein YutE (UPF0331/DUF86 family)
MFFVDRQQIDTRLNILPELVVTADRIAAAWDADDRILRAALERVVHLALEVVTDIGSLLIDGFIMRDAASYEDIIAIMLDEHVVNGKQADFLTRLVRQRKPLVQDFMSIDRTVLLELALQFGHELPAFADGVRTFMDKETGGAV